MPDYHSHFQFPSEGASGSRPPVPDKGGQQQQTQGQQGRAYAMDAEQTVDRSVIRGTVLVFGTVARVLIDTGASHSFISATLARTMRLTHSFISATQTHYAIDTFEPEDAAHSDYTSPQQHYTLPYMQRLHSSYCGIRAHL